MILLQKLTFCGISVTALSVMLRLVPLYRGLFIYSWDYVWNKIYVCVCVCVWLYKMPAKHVDRERKRYCMSCEQQIAFDNILRYYSVHFNKHLIICTTRSPHNNLLNMHESLLRVCVWNLVGLGVNYINGCKLLVSTIQIVEYWKYIYIKFKCYLETF